MKRLVGFSICGRFYQLFALLFYLPFTACTVQPNTSTIVSFEIVAQGEPYVGRGREPIVFALQNDGQTHAIPDGLPEQAQEALRRIFDKSDSAVYVVIYSGRHGSTGYKVQINGMTLHREILSTRLVITYNVNSPPPEQPVLTVITHPFAIARLNDAQINASNVIFEKQ
ncbi:MAG: protease complex subunit PrcB family protein [Chloroflexi bacterium]|nr:protease complex subunit PrcB family protein [Chloroflexota bacterium]